MPPPERTDRKQRAVLWAVTGTNNHGQKVCTTTGVELKVRWVGKQAVRLDPQGNTIAVDATVIVAQDVTIGSIMWLGALADIPGTGTPPLPESDLMQVKTFDKTDSMNPNFVRREVGLMRYNDTFPSS